MNVPTGTNCGYGDLSPRFYRYDAGDAVGIVWIVESRVTGSAHGYVRSESTGRPAQISIPNDWKRHAQLEPAAPTWLKLVASA